MDDDYRQRTQGLYKEMEKLQLSLAKIKYKSDRFKIYGKMKVLRKYLLKIQIEVIDKILASADVICCTLINAADKKLMNHVKYHRKGVPFDVLVIDECS